MITLITASMLPWVNSVIGQSDRGSSSIDSLTFCSEIQYPSLLGYIFIGRKTWFDKTYFLSCYKKRFLGYKEF